MARGGACRNRAARATTRLLARAALAHDRHGEVALRQPRDDAVYLLHRGRAAYDRQSVFALLADGRALAVRHRERALHDGDQLLHVEGLGQVVECAALRRGDGGEDGVLRAHDHDGEIGANVLDARDEVEAVLVGQHDVGDDKLALAARHRAPQSRGGAGGAHVVAGAAECLRQHGADRGVVVGDEDGGDHYAAAPVSNFGRRTRNSVRPGMESHSTTPP